MSSAIDADSLDGESNADNAPTIAVVNGQQFRRSGNFERPATAATTAATTTPQQRTARIVKKPAASAADILAAAAAGGAVSNDSTPDRSSSTAAVAMNPRMEVALKREQRLREEEANYTHKPRLATATTASAKTSTAAAATAEGGGSSAKQKEEVNRFDRLYSDALKRHLESKWKESNNNSSESFTPKISARGSRASSRSASRERPATAASSAAMNESSSRLHSARTGRQKETAAAAAEYSFQPTISKRAKSIDRRESLKRLYDLKEPQQRKEAMRAELQRQELAQCTFAPLLQQSQQHSKYSKRVSSLDVAQRMAKYEEMKARRLEQALLEKQQAELEGVTFKPDLSAAAAHYNNNSNNSSDKRRSATPTRQQQEPFHVRLSKSIDRSDERVVAEAHADLTFQPKLATAATAAATNSSGAGGSASKRAPSPGKYSSGDYSSVHDKLFAEGLQRKREAEQQRKLAKEEMETSFSFSPAINPRSRAVAAAATAAGNNNGNGSSASKAAAAVPVFERLATANSMQYMQDVLQKVKADLELKDCTFQPKLMTEGSAYFDRSRSAVPVHERLNSEGEAHRAELQRLSELAQQQRQQQLSFAPHINENSKELVKHRVSIATPDVYSRLNAEEIECHTLQSQLQSPTGTVGSSIPNGLASPNGHDVVLTEKQRDAVARRLSSTQTHHVSASAEEEHNNALLGISQPSPHQQLKSPHSGGSGCFFSETASVASRNSRSSSRLSMSQREVDGVVQRLHSKQRSHSAAAASPSPTATTSAAKSTTTTPRSTAAAASAGRLQKKTPTTAGATTTPTAATVTASGAAKKSREKPLITPSTIHQVYKNEANNRSTFDFMDNPITTTPTDESTAVTTSTTATTAATTATAVAAAGAQQAERIVHASPATTSAMQRSLSNPHSAIRKNTIAADALLQQQLPKAPSKATTTAAAGGKEKPLPPTPPSNAAAGAEKKISRKMSATIAKPATTTTAAAAVTSSGKAATAGSSSSAKAKSSSSRGGSRDVSPAPAGDDFAAKIERSLSLLGMTPEQVTAAQRQAEADEAAEDAAAIAAGADGSSSQ